MEISHLKGFSSSMSALGALDGINSAVAAHRKQMELYNNLIHPSVQRAISGLNTINPLIQSACGILKHHEAINSAARAAAGVGFYTDGLAKAIGGSFAFESIIQQVSSAQKLALDYQALLKTDASIYDAFRQEFRIETALKRALSDLDALTQPFHDVEIEIGHAENDNVVSTTADVIDENSLPSREYIKLQYAAFRRQHPLAQTAAVIYFVITILIPMCQYLHGAYESAKSAECGRVCAELEATIQEMQDEVVRLTDEFLTRRIYEARRPSPISTIQKYSGASEGCIAKGDLVEVTETQGKWVFVTPLDDTDCSGWVKKKYLRRFEQLYPSGSGPYST